MTSKTRNQKMETEVQSQSEEWMQRAQEAARNFNLDIPTEEVSTEEAEQRRFEQEDGE